MALLELNALGVIGGTAPNVTNWMYESHKNALITGGVLVVIFYVVFYLVLKSNFRSRALRARAAWPRLAAPQRYLRRGRSPRASALGRFAPGPHGHGSLRRSDTCDADARL